MASPSRSAIDFEIKGALTVLAMTRRSHGGSHGDLPFVNSLAPNAMGDC